MRHFNFKYFQTSFDNKTHFLKIHAPSEVIQRNSEIADMKPPVREFYVTFYTNNKTDLKSNSEVIVIKESTFLNYCSPFIL